MSAVSPGTRFLIACPDCHRQFDVTGRPVGAEVSCSCGARLTVTRPSAHDAAVIRCSSCGAPREGQAQVCRYCAGEFTLHERDLTTICPGCMARVSSKARFCHSCSTPLMQGGAVAPETDLRCPSCTGRPPLVSRRLGRVAVAVYDCATCGGLWMEKEVFEVLADRARAGQMPELASGAVVAPAAASDQGPGASNGPAYRPCVLCGALMNRRNYGRKSGVIVDVCSRHGLWFDLHEIDRLLRWIREGGEDRTKHLQSEEDRTVERQKRLAEKTDSIELDHQMTALVGIQRGSFLTDLMSGDILRAMMRLFE